MPSLEPFELSELSAERDLFFIDLRESLGVDCTVWIDLCCESLGEKFCPKNLLLPVTCLTCSKTLLELLESEECDPELELCELAFKGPPNFNLALSASFSCLSEEFNKKGYLSKLK